MRRRRDDPLDAGTDDHDAKIQRNVRIAPDVKPERVALGPHALFANGSARSKYHQQIKNGTPMLRIADSAVAGGQFSWLSMPCMTETTDSPSRIGVNSPKRSGRCPAAGGTLTLCGTASHGVPRSIANAAAQIQKRAGVGTVADISHNAAATPCPAM